MNHYWQCSQLSLFHFLLYFIFFCTACTSKFIFKEKTLFLISKDYWRWMLKQNYLSPVLLLSKTKILGFVWVKRDSERVKKEAGPGTAAPQEQLSWWVNQYSQNIPNQKLARSLGDRTEKGAAEQERKLLVIMVMPLCIMKKQPRPCESQDRDHVGARIKTTWEPG